MEPYNFIKLSFQAWDNGTVFFAFRLTLTVSPSIGCSGGGDGARQLPHNTDSVDWNVLEHRTSNRWRA